MDEQKKKKLHQLEIAGAVVLLLVSIISFFPNSGITGFVSIETKRQDTNLTFYNSQSYILTTKSNESFTLTSLRLSGVVMGEGKAEIYLDNGQGQKILIYSNIIEKETGGMAITGITGAAVTEDEDLPETGDELLLDYLDNIQPTFRELKPDEMLRFGKFEDECKESCFIDVEMNESIGYQLQFHVEDDTILDITQLTYTMKTDD